MYLTLKKKATKHSLDKYPHNILSLVQENQQF